MNCLNEKDIINTYKNFGYDVFKIDCEYSFSFCWGMWT